MTTAADGNGGRHGALIARIRLEAAALTDRVLASMYADPFWRDRFGARADVHGRKDGQYHLDYVCEALATDDTLVMAMYARWLQGLLTTRGMCSRHIADNFDLLAAELAAWPDGAGAPAVRVLAAATAALAYDTGPAAGLLAAEDAIVARARAEALTSTERELRHLVSYAADALALDDQSVFAKHVAWLAPRMPHLPQALAALAEAGDRADVPQLRAILDVP